MSSLRDHKKNLTDICHLLYEKGFVTATDGNVSVRVSPNEILTTPTSLCKGWVKEDDLVLIDAEGNHFEGTGRASTEIKMHLFMYQQRSDVNAVVHAHPPHLTGFAVAGEALDHHVLPEVIVGIGKIPLAKYATPSTHEVSESLSPYIKDHDVILMQNHGAVACGKDLWEAYFRIEKAEHAAKIIYIARMLGGERKLTKHEVEKLRAMSVKSYGRG